MNSQTLAKMLSILLNDNNKENKKKDKTVFCTPQTKYTQIRVQNTPRKRLELSSHVITLSVVTCRTLKPSKLHVSKMTIYSMLAGQSLHCEKNEGPNQAK